MKIDLLQFVVPLTFLAIWAVTSLFNREAQPLPPRTMRPPGPPGPRPGMPPGPLRPIERRPEPLSRDPSARWSTPRVPERSIARRPGGLPDDDILIIESEPRRPNSPSSNPAPPRPGASTAPRRNVRNRPAATPPAKRPEPTTQRALTTSMAQDTATSMAHDAATTIPRHLELNPLARVQSPLSTQESHDIKADPGAARSTLPAALEVIDIRQLLSTPAKLRESIILNELLQPPLALRRPRPRGTWPDQG